MHPGKVKERFDILGPLTQRDLEDVLGTIKVAGPKRRQAQVLQDLDVGRVALESTRKCGLRPVVFFPVGQGDA